MLIDRIAFLTRLMFSVATILLTSGELTHARTMPAEHEEAAADTQPADTEEVEVDPGEKAKTVATPSAGSQQALEVPRMPTRRTSTDLPQPARERKEKVDPELERMRVRRAMIRQQAARELEQLQRLHDLRDLRIGLYHLQEADARRRISNGIGQLDTWTGSIEDGPEITLSPFNLEERLMREVSELRRLSDLELKPKGFYDLERLSHLRNLERSIKQLKSMNREYVHTRTVQGTRQSQDRPLIQRKIRTTRGSTRQSGIRNP